MDEVLRAGLSCLTDTFGMETVLTGCFGAAATGSSSSKSSTSSSSAFLDDDLLDSDDDDFLDDDQEDKPVKKFFQKFSKTLILISNPICLMAQCE